jgi:hypothetical protein
MPQGAVPGRLLSSKIVPVGMTFEEGFTMKWTIALAIVGVLFGASSAIAQGAACDKTCLMSTADAYLAALVAHDASKAPMAPNAKFTEQTKVMKVGDEGLWKSAISVSPTFKIPVADPVSSPWSLELGSWSVLRPWSVLGPRVLVRAYEATTFDPIRRLCLTVGSPDVYSNAADG